MNRKDSLAKMHDALVMRREAIRRALNGDLSLLQEMRQTGCDVVDFASESAAEELSSQLVEVESRELAQIDHALARLKDNSYGVCEDCDKPIPLTRLQALPYASLCIACQRELEEAEESAGTGAWPVINSPTTFQYGDVDPV